MNTMNQNSNDILNSAFSGLKLQDNANADRVATLLDKFGLRWNVGKQPLYLGDGTATPFNAVVREDTGTSFTTVKSGYVPFQNSELAELLIRISDKAGYEIHSGGEFNGGGKVYLQLNSGNQITDLGKNRTTVNGFVTGLNSHDGTTSLKWGSVNFTVCCRNTFAMAQRTLENSARHTASIHDRVDQALRQIELVAAEEKSIFDTFIRLSNVPVTKANIAKIVKQATGVDIDKSKSDARTEVSTYAINRAGELTNSIARELDAKGDTLWGLFSGVTHYTSHVMSTPKRDNARLESKYIGSGATMDNEAYKTILQMA